MKQYIQHRPRRCRQRVKYINIGVQPLYLFIIFTVNYPSFPFVAEEKDVGTEITGLIFASWSFPAFIFPFILPRLLRCFGKRRLFIVSLAIAAVSMCATGLLPLFDKVTFLILAFGFRILQGTMAAIMNPMYFSLGAQLYPQTKDNVYAWQVLTTVCGIGMGPLLGAPLYKSLGFDVVQYFIGLIGLVVFLPLAIFGIPALVDQKKKRKKQGQYMKDSENSDEPLLVQNGQFNCNQ